jgi:predicted ATPase
MTQRTFKHNTGWVVITGAPSSGKTSVVDELARRGYPIQTEVARELIEECLRHGMTLAEIRSMEYVKELQDKILRFKLAREMALDTGRLIFADRGTPDSIVYFRLAGLDVTRAVEASTVYHYKAVFLLDRLPVVKDGVRSEDDTAAAKIGDMIAEAYAALGYDLIPVPVVPVAARVDFILEKLGNPPAPRAQQA